MKTGYEMRESLYALLRSKPRGRTVLNLRKAFRANRTSGLPSAYPILRGLEELENEDRAEWVGQGDRRLWRIT